jgi:hypothetical protein
MPSKNPEKLINGGNVKSPLLRASLSFLLRFTRISARSSYPSASRTSLGIMIEFKGSEPKEFFSNQLHEVHLHFSDQRCRCPPPRGKTHLGQVGTDVHTPVKKAA